MKCNLERYMESEELSCRRIARSMNQGTQAEQEWLKTAEAILERRREHLKSCLDCSKE